MTGTSPTALCGAKRRHGGACTRPSGWGTDHVGAGRCKLHGGATPSGSQAANRALLLAEAREWAYDGDVDALELMLSHVRRTAAFAVQIEHRYQQQPDDKGWASMADKANRTAADTASRAIALGIAERRVRMVEQEATTLANAIQGALRDLGDRIPVDVLPDFRRAVFSRLSELEAGPDEIEGTVSE